MRVLVLSAIAMLGLHCAPSPAQAPAPAAPGVSQVTADPERVAAAREVIAAS